MGLLSAIGESGMATATALNKSFSEFDFHSVIEAPSDTSYLSLDRIVHRMSEAKYEFTQLSIDQRIDLIDSFHQGYMNVAKRSVQASCAAKGIEFGSPMEGEEWISGPLCICRHLRLLKESLAQIKQTGTTHIPQPEQLSPDQLSLPIFPNSLVDKALFKGVSIDMRLQKGIDQKQLDADRASFYQNQHHDGKVVLILGAGNLSCIPVMDVLSKLFNEGKTCILKMNPVNAYLGYFIEEAFKEAIDKNYLAVVYGKIEQAKHLLQHEGIDEVHITGSNKTHDYIYWGAPGSERAQRMARNKPLVDKPGTSSLGNVSPVIIFPGKYTKNELHYQAEDIAGAMSFNSGFMCSVPVALITSEQWQQRDEFLSILEQKIHQLPPRQAFYPGAKERWHSATMSSIDFKLFGEEKGHYTPWAFAKGLRADSQTMEIYQNEPFCSVLTETVLGCENNEDFLKRSVEFANDHLWGTLTASIIVDPRSADKTDIATHLETAIDRLEYGTIAINSSFTALSFMTATAAWGAYPGSVLSNIQSGHGWLHNTSMVEGIEKMVARFPIVSSRKPFYFPSHNKKLQLAKKMIDHEINQKWSKVPSILLDMVFA